MNRRERKRIRITKRVVCIDETAKRNDKLKSNEAEVMDKGGEILGKKKERLVERSGVRENVLTSLVLCRLSLFALYNK